MTKYRFLILLYFIVIIVGALGYVLNIVKLIKTDFHAPLKAEILRGVGVVVPPVGAVEGFIRIND